VQNKKVSDFWFHILTMSIGSSVMVHGSSESEGKRIVAESFLGVLSH
jgi:hypothetical protein